MLDIGNDQPEKLLSASSHFPDPDLFIMLGDPASNYNSDNEFILNTITAGADVTKSEIPVIYVRGNHELYGEMTDIIFPSLSEGGENGNTRFFTALERLGVKARFSGHLHSLNLFKPGEGRYAPPHALLIDGGPKDGYTGDYICSMAQVNSNGDMKFLAYDSKGEKLLDETIKTN